MDLLTGYEHHEHTFDRIVGAQRTNLPSIYLPIDIRDTIHPPQLICSYALTNLPPAATPNKFFLQLEAITLSNLWLLMGFNARVG